ncbi:hypothetical protein Tco_0706287 [Tanacetum coccineum]|uniref:Transposase (Putative), gypsy type n=1 Tax=Tanacetum coccineum TaxID=301880 RepID=A0ABQ4Y7X1_9ASTR
MGRDTIQIKDVVSTISGVYLLEFTSEYGIPEGLYPLLPGLEDTIMDFLEGKVGAPKDEMPSIDSHSALDVATLNTRRTHFKKQPELLLCLVGLSQRYFLGDDVYPTFLNDDDREMDLFNLISAPNPAKVKTGTRPRTAHSKSPLDFSSEDPPPMITNKDETKDQAPVVASQEVSSAENTVTAEVIPELNLEKETIAKEPPINKRRRKRVKVRCREMHLLGYSKIAAVVADLDSENTSFTCMVGSPGSIYQPGWGVTNDCRLDTPGVSQDLVDHKAPPGIQARENDIKNLEVLLEAKADMKKAAEAKNVKLAQITGEEKIKAAFEEFKKYEDEQVNSRCAKMDAQLDKLSMDFDEELYPHMLIAIVGRRWVIGYGLCLAVMRCAELSEIRRAFADVVWVGLAKDQLEKLRDAPMELIMASLHLESDTREDAPQWVRDLRPTLTVAPQGPAILLADTSTQTEISEGEASPRLLRSMSLPAMYNLDWP